MKFFMDSDTVPPYNYFVILSDVIFRKIISIISCDIKFTGIFQIKMNW